MAQSSKQYVGPAGGSTNKRNKIASIPKAVTTLKSKNLQETKYKKLLESIDQGFCVIEMLFDSTNQPVDYTFIETNKIFDKQTGLKNATGKTARELVPSLEKHWFETYGKVATSGKSVTFSYGSEAMGKWFEVYASRFGDPQGYQVALLFTDISERIHAENEQHASSQQVIDVLESMSDAFFMLDKDWKIIRVNNVQEKISQTKRKDTIGKSFWEVFPATAEPTSQYWIQYNKVMKTRKPVNFEEFYEPLGVWTEVSAYPTKNETISVFFRDITSRKKKEEELKGNEERFRTLIEQSTDAIQLVSREGEILYSSDSLKNVLGYSPAEIQGVGLTPFLHPDDAPYFYKKFGSLLKNPLKPINLQYRVKHKDGSWAWLETTGINHLETPNISALVGTFRNITKRKKSEEELKYQRSLLVAQQEVSPLGIIVVSEEGKMVNYNKRFADMWRFPKDVMDTDLDTVALRAAQEQLVDPKAFIDRVMYLYKEREPSNEKLYFTDGRVFDRYGSPIFGEDNKYYGYVWYFLDITESVQAQKALKRSEKRLRFMAESMPQKVFTATASGDIDYFNPQWMEFTGLSFEQIRDWGWVQFIHPDDVEENIRRWKHSIETGELFELEHRFKHRDGSYHWHISRAHALRDEQGKIIKWIGSNTDIEAVKRTQSRKKQLEEMTTSLREQRAQLIALNEAKDEFISLASHQLRTPATGVKQYLGMVLEGYAGQISEDQKIMLEQANTSNERQINIINDLLKVAQVDAGKVKLKKSHTSVNALVREVLDGQHSKFKERDQKVEFDPHQDDIKTHLDQDRMRMVLENIVDNASKYTPEGKKIKVHVASHNDEVAIAVQDDGVGIDEEDIDKLFRKFSRLDNPLSLIVGGTGLGLYWAKKIIELHEGTITVDSVTGKGSTFTITLPAHP